MPLPHTHEYLYIHFYPGSCVSATSSLRKYRFSLSFLTNPLFQKQLMLGVIFPFLKVFCVPFGSYHMPNSIWCSLIFYGSNFLEEEEEKPIMSSKEPFIRPVGQDSHNYV
uniref:Uncharacterized protein n=1 Tax=Cacopsylla melanoneura TaxID=428564 RepID=A0A8D8WSE6_9HEMI